MYLVIDLYKLRNNCCVSAPVSLYPLQLNPLSKTSSLEWLCHSVALTQSTPMKPELTPTVRYNPPHPSSCLVFSTDSSDNPNNPGPNTNQLPSITDWGTWASIPTLVFGASTNTQWVSRHLGIHPAHDWAEAHHRFPSNPDPVSP